jgi:hypothetical protein
MTTGCATLTLTPGTLTLTLTSANPVAMRRHTRSRLTALMAKVFAVAATSILIDALLYGIGSRSVPAGVARFLAVWSASAQPMGHALALAVFGMLSAAAGATLGHVTDGDVTWYPALLLATTTSCAWAAAAVRRLQSHA